MMVKDVKKFHKHHLGGGCLNVCVRAEFHLDFEFWDGGNSKVWC